MNKVILLLAKASDDKHLVEGYLLYDIWELFAEKEPDPNNVVVSRSRLKLNGS